MGREWGGPIPYHDNSNRAGHSAAPIRSASHQHGRIPPGLGFEYSQMFLHPDIGAVIDGVRAFMVYRPAIARIKPKRGGILGIRQ